MQKKDCDDSTGINLTVVNATTGQSILYTGQDDPLHFTLINNTGSKITFIPYQGMASTLEIFLLPLFRPEDLDNMKTSLPGWTLSVNKPDQSLLLECTEEGVWENGAAFSFQITGAKSSAMPPQAFTIQVNPSNMLGNEIPSQTQTCLPLSLQKPNDGQKTDLDTVLQLELENDGVIYISDNADVLITNSLTLNIKNQSPLPLYSKTTPWPTVPRVLVYCVYGYGPGALAPDDDKDSPQNGSAWNIKPGQMISEGNSWDFKPDNISQSNQPQWWLLPKKIDPGMIGTGANANISFEFDNIVSLTPVGHTQMYVQFSDFPGYNDQIFVLDIDKQDLAGRTGLLKFYSDVSKVEITRNNEPVNIPLYFQMTEVSKIELDFSLDCVASITKKYTGLQQVVQNESFTVQIDCIEQGTELTITCNAYGTNAEAPDGYVFLNSLSIPVKVEFPPIVSSYQADIQADRSVVLSWKTEGATAVNFPHINNAEPYLKEGTITVPREQAQFPIPENTFYQLVASNNRSDNNTSQPYLLTNIYGFAPLTGPIVMPAYENWLPTPIAVTFSPDYKYLYVFCGNFTYLTSSIIIYTVDGDTPYQLLQSIQLPLRSLGFTVSPDGKYIYVVSDYGNTQTVTPILVDGNPAENQPPFSMLPALTIGNNNSSGEAMPLGVAATPDNKYLFVSLSGTVVAIQPGTPSVNPVDIPAGNTPVGLAVSPDNRYLFVANYGDNTVSVIDAHSFKALQKPVPVGNSPIALQTSVDGQYLFVSNTGSNTVSVIAINTPAPFQVIASCQVGSSPYNMATSPDGHFLFVSSFNSSTVSVIQLRTDPPFQTLPGTDLGAGCLPMGAAVSQDNMQVAVVDYNKSSIYIMEHTSFIYSAQPQ